LFLYDRRKNDGEERILVNQVEDQEDEKERNKTKIYCASKKLT